MCPSPYTGRKKKLTGNPLTNRTASASHRWGSRQSTRSCWPEPLGQRTNAAIGQSHVHYGRMSGLSDEGITIGTVVGAGRNLEHGNWRPPR